MLEVFTLHGIALHVATTSPSGGAGARMVPSVRTAVTVDARTARAPARAPLRLGPMGLKLWVQVGPRPGIAIWTTGVDRVRRPRPPVRVALPPSGHSESKRPGPSGHHGH